MLKMKKQVPQKKKDKSKPANSKRAAQLLACSNESSQGPVVGVIGFDNDFENVVGQPTDADVYVLLRKFSKKNCITRQKVLKEFCHSIKSKDEKKAVQGIFLCWLRYYNKLAMDGSCKVRKEAHKVMGVLAEALGGDIESSFREIMPILLFGQNDAYQEVRQEASTAIQNVFVDKNNQSWLIPYSDDITTLCLEIVNANSTLFSAQKYDIEEESEQRCIRLICTALRTLEMSLSMMAEKSPEYMCQRMRQSLWNCPKLLKSLANHRYPQIRSSLFFLLGRFVQLFGDDASIYSQCLAKSIVNSLAESDRAVAVNAYDCWIQSLDKETFLQHVDMKKAVIPKFVAILRSRPSSLTDLVLPSILPSMAAIFKTLKVEDQTNFCKLWLQSIIHGLEPRGNERSQVDWLVAFSDCFKFALVKESVSEENLFLIWMFDKLLIIIRMIFDRDLQNCSQLLAQLLLWLYQRHTLVGNGDCYAKFWKNFTAIYDSCSEAVTGDVLKYLVSASKCDVGIDICIHLMNKYVDSEHMSATSVRRLALIAQSNVIRNERLRKYLRDSAFLDRLTTDALNADNTFVLLDLLRTTCSVLIARKDSEITSGGWLQRFTQAEENEFISKALLVVIEERHSDLIVCFDSANFSQFWKKSLLKALEEEDIERRSALISILKVFCEHLKETLISDTLDVICASFSQINSSGLTAALDCHLAFLCDLLLPLLPVKNQLTTSTDTLKISCNDNIELCIQDLILKFWNVMLDFSGNISDATIIKLKKFVQMFVRGSDIIIKLADQIISRLNGQFMETEKMKWIASCALFLASFSRDSNVMGEYVFSEDVEAGLSASLSAQYCQQIWMSARVVLTACSACSERANKDHLACFINRATFLALCLSSTDLCQFQLYNKADLSALGGLIAFKGCALGRLLLQQNLLDRQASKLVELLDNVVLQLSTDATICDIITDQLLRINFKQTIFDPLTLLTFQLISALCKSVVNVQQKIDNLMKEGDWQTGCLLSACARLELTGDPESLLQGTPLDKWPALFQLCSNSYSINSSFTNALITAIFDQREHIRNKLILSSESLNSWPLIEFNVSFTRFISKTVKERLMLLSSEERDFICCYLISLLQTCREISEAEDEDVERLNFNLLSFEVMLLFNSVSSTVSGMDPTSQFAQTWLQFFSEACSAILVPWFFRVIPKNVGPFQLDYISKGLCSAVQSFNKKSLLSVKIPVIMLDASMDQRTYPVNLQSILITAQGLIKAPQKCIKIAAWSIMKSLLTEIWKTERLFLEASLRSIKKASAFESDDNNDLELLGTNMNKLPIILMKPIEEWSTDSLHEALMNERLEEILSFLLYWDLVLHYIDLTDNTYKYTYLDQIIANGDWERFLASLFDVLPERLNLHKASSSETLSLCQLFTEHYIGSFDDVKYLRRELEHVCCFLLYQCFASHPALVRQWHNSQPKAMANVVDKFTRQYISGLICDKEMATVAQSRAAVGNLTVTTRPAVREVLASYRIEDTIMQLTVSLPINYPLSMATVDSERPLVAAHLKRKWLFQLTAYLAHQNGSVLEGLLMWKQNVDRHLSGVEDCVICAMTVHLSNHQLPRVSCSRCKKRFHGACLYKWFQSSNQSTCPTCRSLF